MTIRTSPRAFAISEIVALIAGAVAVFAVAVPPLSTAHEANTLSSSLGRLRKLGFAQAMYATDFGGRQYTSTVDDISAYGSGTTDAFFNYEAVTGSPHPPVILGNDALGSTWGFYMSYPGNYAVGLPFNFTQPSASFGWFRIANARPLHDYVDGKFYSRTFYTNGDTVAWNAVEALLDGPDEFVPTGGLPYWSSYALSPAALLDPAVMARADGAGSTGWRDPFDLPAGFRAPALFQARYPDLKTFILEHHWNQNAPNDRCNPAFSDGTYDGCEPYYFNHAWASEPATLFYDLSTRTLPVTEAIAADRQVKDPFEGGLWKRDTPFGASGYLSDYSYDLADTSFHILTTDGILGRDTVR